MNAFFEDLKTSLLTLLLLAVLCCGLYPFTVWAVSQLAFSNQANGSLLHDPSGRLIGSSLLGQNFNGSTYFNPRPSAAGAAGYDASSSGGSNYGPTSQKLIDQVKSRVADYRKMNSLSEETPVPADAVTASASGLDPHISPKNALLQLPRVAKARSLSEEQVGLLVKKYTEGPDWGLLGEPGINVLKLNLALDQLPAKK